MSGPAHVVVLAAGRGSRLGAHGDDRPKWLLEVGGRTIADRHLEALGLAATRGDVATARVVTGHAAGAIERRIAGRSGVLRVSALFNPRWDRWNNWFSLLLALRAVPADDGPVVVVNADLLAGPGWLDAFVRHARTSAADGLLAVDLERRITPESMGVERGPDGALARIGKTGLDRPEGEYVGMLAARGTVLADLRAELESFVGRPERANEWYEAAVGRSAAAGTRWDVWPTPGSAWVEIDDLGDLRAAEALVA